MGVLAAGGTALYFLAKEKKVGVKAGIDIRLGFQSGNYDDYFGIKNLLAKSIAV